MFKVHDKKKFSKGIMLKYFRHNRYKSFLRQLSMYNFHRVRDEYKGNRGAYKHDHFRKGQVELSVHIIRQSKKSAINRAVKNNEEEKSSKQQGQMPSYSMRKCSVDPFKCEELEGESSVLVDLSEKLTNETMCGNVVQDSPFKLLRLQNYGISFLPGTLPLDIMDEIIRTFAGTN